MVSWASISPNGTTIVDGTTVAQRRDVCAEPIFPRSLVRVNGHVVTLPNGNQ